MHDLLYKTNLKHILIVGNNYNWNWLFEANYIELCLIELMATNQGLANWIKKAVYYVNSAVLEAFVVFYMRHNLFTHAN